VTAILRWADALNGLGFVVPEIPNIIRILPKELVVTLEIEARKQAG
jgi:hypothetical protein